MTAAPSTGMLREIGSPADLRSLPPQLLPALAEEIRAFLVDRVCASGGHLGPNLGVVEVTIALHRVFDSPTDALVFDTGHQSYVHKILTGRAERFDSLRAAGGLSGYPCRAESVHDLVENSHASTALSYADGIATGFTLREEYERHAVAVLGDGALTGGMCWEALNNIGANPWRPLIVVLNDNGRSYAPTVGGLARHLAALRDGDTGGRNVFEDLGLAYIGPIDGHDIAEVEAALREATLAHRAVVVHCVTRKGRGYPPAERDTVDHMHGIGVTDPRTGRARAGSGPSWTDVFGAEITGIGAEREDVVCLTAAMLHPLGLSGFAEAYPDRVFDVGMAEQHLVTSAAGLAIGGMHPVVAVYATFLNRAFDQVLMDVALHRLPVTFVLDRAGVTGPDGASHHGVWDAGILAMVPGLRLAAPRDATRLRELLQEAIGHCGPTALRYPKGTTGPDIPAQRRIGRYDVLAEPEDAEVLLIGVGPLAGTCVAAATLLTEHGVPAGVVDPRWIAPLDPALTALAGEHRLALTVEDSTGSLGQRLAHALSGGDTRVGTLALPREFLLHGSRSELLREHGMDADGIVATVLAYLNPRAEPIPEQKERQ